MLHTYQHTMYVYFFMEHMGDIGFCDFRYQPPTLVFLLLLPSKAIVRHFGKPSLFTTFTASPKWTRITDELLPGQVAFDRPDLIARVFNLKVRHFLNDLKTKNIFGRYKGLVRTISTKNEACFTYTSYSFLDPEDNFTDAEKID